MQECPKISADALPVLQALKLEPNYLTKSETVEELKGHFAWIRSQSPDSALSLLAFSGEADPNIWNYVEYDLRKSLDLGLIYKHCLGPVVCTDNDNNRNTILEVFKDYPEAVELYLFRIRQPYHWTCFTSQASLKYHFRGECYHHPLENGRGNFNITLEDEHDEFFAMKRSFWHKKQNEFKTLMPIMDKVSEIKDVPTLTESEFEKVYNNANKQKMFIEILNRDEILKLASIQD